MANAAYLAEQSRSIQVGPLERKATAQACEHRLERLELPFRHLRRNHDSFDEVVHVDRREGARWHLDRMIKHRDAELCQGRRLRDDGANLLFRGELRTLMNERKEQVAA